MYPNINTNLSTNTSSNIEAFYKNIPYDLKLREQWVLREGKEPYDAKTRQRASHSDPATWAPFAKALAVYERNPDQWSGIGFVFSDEDPYAGIDLDHCRDPKTGAIAEWALDILAGFKGAYIEVSPSGAGLHIICRGNAPNRKNQKAGVEAYSSKRFFTVSGNVVEAFAEELPNHQDAIDALTAKYFPTQNLDDNVNEVQTPTEPVDLDDRELMEKARNAGDGMGEMFVKLHDLGDYSDFPSHSEARHAYLKNAAYWTGHDPERMSRWYEASALIDAGEKDYRKKWHRLWRRECERAIADQPKAYRQGPINSGNTRPGSDAHQLAQTIEALKAHAAGLAWEGRTGPTDRHIYSALLNVAERYGSIAKKGLITAADMRTLALEAGTGLKTVQASLKRLADKKERNLIRLSRKGTAKRAAVYLLRYPKTTVTEGYIKPCVVYVPLCHQLRNPGPTSEKEYDSKGRKRSVGSRYLLNRLGKHAALILEYVVIYGGGVGLTLPDLGEALGRRPQDIAKTKAFQRLISENWLAWDGDALKVCDDLEWRLQVELEESGCVDARERDAKRYADERRAFRSRDERPADDGPTDEEMDRARAERTEKAFGALSREGSGPNKTANAYFDGETKNFGYVVGAVCYEVFGFLNDDVRALWDRPVREAYALYFGEVLGRKKEQS